LRPKLSLQSIRNIVPLYVFARTQFFGGANSLRSVADVWQLASPFPCNEPRAAAIVSMKLGAGKVRMGFVDALKFWFSSDTFNGYC